MKAKWKCFGRSFNHTSNGHTGKCSVHGKLPLYVEWCFNEESETGIYMGAQIFRFFGRHKARRKFAWLLESKAIFPHHYEEVKSRYEELFEEYEAIFTHDRELLLLDDRFKFAIAYGYWVKDTGIHPKSKLCSGVSSGKTMCDGHRYRNEYMEKHQQHFDYFGRNFRPFDRKEEVLNDYMFSVNFENAAYPSYFTEKLLDCFATGTIPIYKGPPDIGDFFNMDGIILAEDPAFSFDQLTPDLYYSKMEAIKDNFERIRAPYFQSTEDYIYYFYKEEFGWE